MSNVGKKNQESSTKDSEKTNKDQENKEKQLIATIKKFKEENKKQEQLIEHLKKQPVDESTERLVNQIEHQELEIEKLKKLKPKNSDDIAPGIRSQDTFQGGYRNGFEDGTVEQFQKEHPVVQK